MDLIVESRLAYLCCAFAGVTGGASLVVLLFISRPTTGSPVRAADPKLRLLPRHDHFHGVRFVLDQITADIHGGAEKLA